MGIGLTISTILESESCPPANEELFQFYFDAAHLVQQFGKYTQHDTLRSQLEKPILALFHPTKPDGSLLLNELKHATRPGRRLETHAFWAAYRPSTRYAFASWLFRLSYILRLQGSYLATAFGYLTILTDCLQAIQPTRIGSTLV